MLHWSELDNERFNLKTAKIYVDEDIDIDTLLTDFRKEQGQLLIAKCDTSYKQSLNKLFDEGFFVTDTILKFSMDVDSSLDDNYDDSSIEVQVADKSISHKLGEITKEAFQDYKSHYHNNPCLDSSRCDEVYEDWAKNLVIKDGMADVVYACRYNGNIAGFASLKVQKEVAVAGLLCVDPEFEGEGVAKILHQKRFEWCRDHEIRKFQINTSINNQNYINLLINMGYRFHSAVYVLHLNNF
ncbi:MAG: GNAT family N-acetyltransferase [Bacteroidetes bacterium]|jgi:GNAT superfamily N-acetyltransferase|nr:GNAT family N-acetyltransferase [Bacteroidota bacterium]